MNVLVCGDRYWTNKEVIYKVLDDLAEVSDEYPCGARLITIIEGAATGADYIAGDWAVNSWNKLCEVPADWGTYGNQKMLDQHIPDLVLAFHDKIEDSKGTKDMVNRARKAGIEVRIYNSQGVELVK